MGIVVWLSVNLLQSSCLTEEATGYVWLVRLVEGQGKVAECHGHALSALTATALNAGETRSNTTGPIL